MDYRIGILFNNIELFPPQKSTSYSSEFNHEDILETVLDKGMDVDGNIFDTLIIERAFNLYISNSEREMLKELRCNKLIMRNNKRESHTFEAPW